MNMVASAHTQVDEAWLEMSLYLSAMIFIRIQLQLDLILVYC